MEKSKELNTAITAAKKAGKILLQSLGKQSVVKYKDRQDISTTADIASEKAIISLIEKNFPSHSIVSEEIGEIRKDSEFCWFVDPLDGTKNFVRGIPIFTVSVALANKEEILVGAVFDPSTKRLYYAEKGKGAFLNGKKITVSGIANPEDAFAYIDSPQKKFNYLSKNFYRTRDFGVGSLALCYLAQGGFDAYLQDTLKLPDHAAGLLIAKEAGAAIAGLDGKNFSLQSKDCFVANPMLHKKILFLLA